MTSESVAANFYHLPERHRRLMLTIMDDDIERVEEYAFLLQYIFEHMPRGKNLAALEYLVKNKILGRNFLGFYFVEGKDSPLELVRVLTAKIHKRAELRPLIFGRDMM